MTPGPGGVPIAGAKGSTGAQSGNAAAPGKAGNGPTPDHPGTATGSTDENSTERMLARGEGLDEALQLAFIAGYDFDENVYLRGASGTVRQVSTWPLETAASDCPMVWSTGGYVVGAGRFSPLQLTHDGKELLFVEKVSCERAGEEHRRILLHEIASGTTFVLADTSSLPQLAVGPDGVFVIVRHDEGGDVGERASDGSVELFVLSGHVLQRLAVPKSDTWISVPYRNAVNVHWQDHAFLLIDGLPPLEWRDGQLVTSSVLEPLDDHGVWRIQASPSGQRLCVVTSRKPSLGADGGAVLTADGRWLEAPRSEPVSTVCFFSPDERRVVLGSAVFDLGEDELSAAASDTLPPYSRPWRDGFYGNDANGITGLDWATLTSESSLPVSSIPPTCLSPGHPAVTPSLWMETPPDDRPIAVVKASCGCIDCDISGTFIWHAESGELVAAEPAADHEVFGVAWLPDGGAAITSTQTTYSVDDGTKHTAPAAGSFLYVRPDGTVETVGPLAGVHGVMHSPVSFPGTLASSPF